MSTFKKIFFSLLIIFVLAFISLNVFLFFKGKDILNQRLSSATGRKIEIHKLWFKLPFSIFIDGVTIDGISPAKEVLVKVGFSNVFRSQFTIKRIVLKGARLTVVRDETGKISFKGIGSQGSEQMLTVNLPSKTSETSAPKTVDAANSEVKNDQRTIPRIAIQNIVFEDSLLEFINQNASDADSLKFKQVTLEDFSLKIKDFIWPLDPRPVTYSLKGMLSVPDFSVNRKSLKSDGWVNVLKKDMKSVLDVAESESESSLHAQFVSKDNDMKVTGNIKMSNFMQHPSKNESGEKGLDQMIFGALSQMGVEVGLDFAFQTRMDHFEMTNVSFTGNVVTKPVAKDEPKTEQK